jgi:hypothetical protein
MAKKRPYRSKIRTRERICIISIRCTPVQKSIIQMVARSKGKTISALLLDRFVDVRAGRGLARPRRPR